MKDVFIDNCSATRFNNKMESEYLDLYLWLLNEGVLVVSDKLICEYSRSNSGYSMSGRNILILISELTRKGRLHKVGKDQIRKFMSKHFKKSVKLRSNVNDHHHIPVVMLSNRKLALSLDGNFRYDVNNFPKFKAEAYEFPSDVKYN
jgi:hypothetical protein